jgi:hypothetical protein
LLSRCLAVAVFVLIRPDILRVFLFAVCLRVGIFIITYEDAETLDQSPYGQSAVSPAKRNASSTTGKRTGLVVFGRKLLRSAGPDPGQIRDAAQGPERRDADQRRSRQFRDFPAGFLQGPAGLRARRPGGPNSPTTRTETRPQVDRGSSGVREAYPHSGAGYDNAGASAKNSEEVFLPGAPQDRGASTGKRGNDHTLALVRLVLGIIFFMHGAQKTLA